MLTEHRTLQPSLNRDTADDFRATKALADASACLVDRRVCLSPALLAWVALEALALKWNFGWKGLGHTGTDWMRVVTEQSPNTSSLLLPILAFRQRRQTGPSLRPQERSREERRPRPASLASGRANWPPAPGSRRDARIPNELRRPTKPKPGPRAQAGRAQSGAGRAARAGGVGCHPPRTPRPGGGEANH